jgi:hypothetical protein
MTDQLTTSELEELRRSVKARHDFFRKAFEKNRPRMLMPSPTKELRRSAREDAAYFQKVFAKYRPKGEN